MTDDIPVIRLSKNAANYRRRYAALTLGIFALVGTIVTVWVSVVIANTAPPTIADVGGTLNYSNVSDESISLRLTVTAVSVVQRTVESGFDSYPEKAAFYDVSVTEVNTSRVPYYLYLGNQFALAGNGTWYPMDKIETGIENKYDITQILDPGQSTKYNILFGGPINEPQTIIFCYPGFTYNTDGSIIVMPGEIGETWKLAY